MSPSMRSLLFVCSIATVLIASAFDASADISRDALGFRAGLSSGPDQILIGGQAEFGPVVNTSYLVPSLDIGMNDQTTVTANVDLRWYLLPLPETGIYLYGSAGPTLLLSPGTEIGLSLTAGFDIPMRHQRRYNVEFRFGLGDIPDFKVVGAILFGL